WEGSEGINQVLVDYWYEQAINPILINEVRFDQLANLQGVSPVDAKAILNYREQVGRISSQRDLRSASYLSYYGYRNARSFLTFETPVEKKEFHGHWRVRMDDSPLMADEADADQSIPVTFASNSNYPAFNSTFTGTYGKNIRVGFSQYHAYQEPYHYKDLGIIQIPEYKFYIGWENLNLGNIDIRKIYAGYFSLSFGKGVVMRNNDYFMPRNSGYGFRKSFIGLSGDVSINRQYSLRGLAAEMSYKNMDAWFFASKNSRDAILNVRPSYVNGQPETTVNQFIVLDQRYDYAPADYTRLDRQLSWLNSVNEVTYGSRFQYNFSPGNHVGTTIYESLYDKYLRPNYKEIVDSDNYGQIDATDSEMFATYGGEETDGESALWGDAKSFRRVYGFDFQYVYRNLALQGEYAELDKNHDFSILGDNPFAMVLNAYLQYNSFNFLALYRNYDLDFDNPYQRSFSNYRRFKKTIYEDYYYLQDPLYGQLYSNNPQPQAEKGYFVKSRYQVSRYFLPTIEYDQWHRKSDDAKYYRLRLSGDIRFSFPIRLSLRQKFQSREANNEKTLLFYKTNEFMGKLRLMLSDYNELAIFYNNSYTEFTPRPRFIFEPNTEGEETANLLRSGTAESPGEALGA
ncbi:MAG: helix-hairpin-helix domain-containing protein, partial [Calditrichia bacterium]|nr:helix-hairpin-helix domain-containing protein [Calditrichia bacterium]